MVMPPGTMFLITEVAKTANDSVAISAWPAASSVPASGVPRVKVIVDRVILAVALEHVLLHPVEIDHRLHLVGTDAAAGGVADHRRRRARRTDEWSAQPRQGAGRAGRHQGATCEGSVRASSVLASHGSLQLQPAVRQFRRILNSERPPFPLACKTSARATAFLDSPTDSCRDRS